MKLLMLLVNLKKTAKHTVFTAFFVVSSLSFCFAHRSEAQTTTATSQSELILLSIDKSKLRAQLHTLPEDPASARLLQTFKIAIGRGVGDKKREGDLRTPEGIYFPTRHIDTSELNPGLYGKQAIALNFPNLMDRSEGKTGHGIWLHGAGDDKRIDTRLVTEGCVAFYNEDIHHLAQWVLPYQSIIIIGNDGDTINAPSDRQEVLLETRQWIMNWQKRYVDNYVEAYHPDFRLHGMNKQAFHQYKKRVFHSYKQIELKIDYLRVVTHPKYAVSIMNQTFKGDDRFTSDGRKILYWFKTANGWKIMREYFGRNRFRQLQFNRPGLRTLNELRQHDLNHFHIHQG